MPLKDPIARQKYESEHGKEYYKRRRSVGLDYYYRHRDKVLARRKELLKDPVYREHTNARKRSSLLNCRYGITPQDYAEMLSEQGNACAICKSTTSNNGRSNQLFDVDHCHTTGKVRGLLCRDCNVTVGVVENKSAKIALIKKYLSLYVEFDPKEQVPVEA